jgi:hypothetical protein
MSHEKTRFGGFFHHRHNLPLTYGPPWQGEQDGDYLRALRITNLGVAATCSTPRNNLASLL